MNVFVISWDGFLEKAVRVAEKLAEAGGKVQIVHSQRNPLASGSSHGVEVSMVSDEDFFGRKFRTVLNAADGKPLLLIQADAECDDWPGLLSRFEHMLAKYPIGVWAPAINHTSWVNQKVNIRAMGTPDLIQVSQTDAIVLGLSNSVVKRLSSLDYASNNLGWGIDWAAIISAISMGQLVVRDLSIRVIHKQGSGYRQSEAAQQQKIFLDQLTDAEKAILVLLRRSHTLSRRTIKVTIGLTDAFDRFVVFAVRIAKNLGLLRRGS